MLWNNYHFKTSKFSPFYSDLESSIMFEVSATDTQALTITFEVPSGITASGSMGYEEAMMSVQLDLSSNVEVKSTIFASSSEVCPESFLDNAIQRWVALLSRYLITLIYL